MLLLGSAFAADELLTPSLLAADCLDELARELDNFGEPGNDFGEPPRLDTAPLVMRPLTTMERKNHIHQSIYEEHQTKITELADHDSELGLLNKATSTKLPKLADHKSAKTGNFMLQIYFWRGQ